MKRLVFLFSVAFLGMSCTQTDTINKELTAIEYFKRGNTSLNLGNYQYAIDDYISAIRINPDYADEFNNRENATDK
tara:strand:+ start:152 stop:379 length:228 start_codon:yes stop_codon:yes gene_type:complete